MTNLIGFLLPPLIALVNQKLTNPTVKFIISIVVSLLVAVAINYQKLAVSSPEQILGSAALIFTEAQIAYRAYWTPTSPVRELLNK